MINMNVRSYSYEAGYTNNSIKYTMTIFTNQSYEVGDTIGTFDMHPKIDLSDTMVFYTN